LTQAYNMLAGEWCRKVGRIVWKFIKREFFGWWPSFRDWVSGKDLCEICGNDRTDYVCVGCERRICDMCNSGYYEDAELCQACRHDITPEEEAYDLRESANYLAEECTCPNACGLSPEEHEYIAKYASTRQA
jgi:hypothetical protein